jgi:putative transposase
LFYFPEWRIQGVRIVKRADGYYCQLMLKLDARDITPQLEPTGRCVGLDMDLKYLYVDSNDNTIEPPKY